MSEAWVNRWFTPNACSFCDDVFAELADVVFMDAWLPEYSKDSKGTSLALVRSSFVNDIFSDGIESSQIDANTISIDKIVQSQAGVIDLKRDLLSYRLYIEQKNKLNSHKKRVRLSDNISLIKKNEFQIKIKMQQLSKSVLKECFQENKFNTSKFKGEMQYNLRIMNRIQLLNKFFKLPSQFIQKIKYHIEK
ncbi:Coenzyme F420 hydrogenase/dehydrogenase, beta subunit C-terminal domain [Methanococcoides seepicolus]|uniref:Coenzyme F420 hydrogenase/dehydrogenase, beta subunit C-terminal domain n=1 Tax=Methanococcoides seepicolus TaxID=2828780 RepID=A0A9E4ZH50_9EURY|nr:Coenzyme F420 hydrogenase/dehydrogenase, beta subunit C-terminal domain [Methanococcoides seepicolus]